LPAPYRTGRESEPAKSTIFGAKFGLIQPLVCNIIWQAGPSPPFTRRKRNGANAVCPDPVTPLIAQVTLYGVARRHRSERNGERRGSHERGRSRGGSRLAPAPAGFPHAAVINRNGYPTDGVGSSIVLQPIPQQWRSCCSDGHTFAFRRPTCRRQRPHGRHSHRTPPARRGRRLLALPARSTRSRRGGCGRGSLLDDGDFVLRVPDVAPCGRLDGARAHCVDADVALGKPWVADETLPPCHPGIEHQNVPVSRGHQRCRVGASWRMWAARIRWQRPYRPARRG